MKYQRLKIFVFLFILVAKHGLAQPFISYGYDILKGNEWSGGIISVNNNYYLAGEGVCRYSEEYDPCSYLLQVSDNGEELDTLIFDPLTYNFCSYGPIVYFNDSIYLFGNDHTFDKYEWRLDIYNSEGQLLISKKYDYFPENHVFTEGLLVDDKNIYLLGRTWDTPGGEEIIILKLNKFGDILGESRLNDFAVPNRVNIVRNIIKTTDGHFATAIRYNEWETLNVRVGICKFDHNFNIIWQDFLPPRGIDNYNFDPSITPTNDGGIVMATGLNTGDSIIWNPDYYLKVGKWPVMLYKYNVAGDIEWIDTLYTRTIQNEFVAPRQLVRKLITAKNGDIIGMGTYEHPLAEPKKWGWLFRYSPDGELKWEHFDSHNQYPSKNFFIDFIEAKNGDLVCTGFLENENGPPDNRTLSWLLRLDSLGCYDFGCSTDTINEIFTIVDEAPIRDQVIDFIISPNPTNSRIKITIANQEFEPVKYQIFSIDGNKKMDGPVNNSLELEIDVVNKLMPGVFILRLVDKNGFALSKKFVFQ